jgi:hypothetical protein
VLVGVVARVIGYGAVVLKSGCEERRVDEAEEDEAEEWVADFAVTG